MDALNRLSSLRGWRPIRLYWSGTQVMVDWARLGDAPHMHPFYQESVGEQLRKPFHHAFRRQTNLAQMLNWHVQSPGIEPCLLTFHVSRCGSTLVPQAFAQSPQHLAMSEPAPMDFLLREALVNGWLTQTEAVAAMRAWLSAWAQRSDAASPPLQAVSIKLDAWNTGCADLLAQAWPQALQVFLTREPLAVLVSQMRERAFYLVPNAMGPHFGLTELNALQQATLPPAEYCARILGSIYADMARVADPSQHLVIDYEELPAAIESVILPRLTWQPNPSERHAMRNRLARHGKRPAEGFTNDTQVKHANADAAWRELAQQWIAPHYQRLLQCSAAALPATETLSEAVL